MAFLLTIVDEDEQSVPIGVYTDSLSTMAAHAAWDALEQDMRREHEDDLEEFRDDQGQYESGESLDEIIASMRQEYWDGFDEVRSPEHVNHTIDTGMGWEYVIRHVWVYGD